MCEHAALSIAPHKNFIEVFDNYIKLTATTATATAAAAAAATTTTTTTA